MYRYQSVLSLLAVLLVLACPVEAEAQSTSDIPIQEAVFFKSGVSYIEHRGAVRGTTATTLHFRDEQMKDVLKSLVLQDLGGGRVGTISYPSRAPLAQTLKRFQVDLSDPQGLGALANQLRGADVTVTTPDRTLEGTIVSAEERDGPQGATQWFLTLYADSGLQSVDFDAVKHLQFEEPALQTEMKKALDAVAKARNKDKNAVQLRFEGSGPRRVRIGYVVKAPVWKTSYRLVLSDDDEGTGHLQGWAIVENQTDADWTNVDLTLVSGRPVSFVQDLYTPTYVDRPAVSPTSNQLVPPKQYEEGIEGKAAQSARDDPSKGQAMDSEAARTAPQPFDPAQGVASAATSGDEGAFFQYQINEVSLPQHQSAMLPIVNESIQVERISLYDPDVHRTHPLHGARLENTTGLHLAAGPVTTFDEGSYGGDARLGDTPPGDVRFLTYALNQNVQVDPGGGKTEETVKTGTIVDGVLKMIRMRIASQTYTIENKAETDVTVIVEHPRRSNWRLAAPPNVEERTPAAYRLRTTVGADATDKLTVKEEKTLTRKYQLLEKNQNQLFSYARTGSLPDDVQEALKKAAELQRSVSQIEEKLSGVQDERDRLRNEQSRIRKNMQAVDPSSEYYQRLLKKLSSTEDEIESRNERVSALKNERADRRDRLRQYLKDLDVE